MALNGIQPAPDRATAPSGQPGRRATEAAERAGTTHQNMARLHPASVWAREGLAQGQRDVPG